MDAQAFFEALSSSSRDNPNINQAYITLYNEINSYLDNDSGLLLSAMNVVVF